MGTGGGPGKDGGASDGFVCGPVCDIYCQYGHALDEHGCATCKCNPPPTCLPVACQDDCPGGHKKDKDGCETCTCAPPICPKLKCPAIACPLGAASDGNGCPTCGCQPPPSACRQLRSAALCAVNGNCRWLSPGCGEPKVEAGCYDKQDIGCRADSCPAGRSCQTVSIDPCAPTLGLVPPIGGCNACAQPTPICL